VVSRTRAPGSRRASRRARCSSTTVLPSPAPPDKRNGPAYERLAYLRCSGWRNTRHAPKSRDAVDRGCARVEKLERETVAPALRRIEAEDPDRCLIGLEHRLKGKGRLAEKVEFDMVKWGVTAE
jgi:hypothetical protein